MENHQNMTKNILEISTLTITMDKKVWDKCKYLILSSFSLKRYMEISIISIRKHTLRSIVSTTLLTVIFM